MSRRHFRDRPIDIYKSMKVIRSEEELVFEDELGSTHHVTSTDSGVRHLVLRDSVSEALCMELCMTLCMPYCSPAAA